MDRFYKQFSFPRDVLSKAAKTHHQPAVTLLFRFQYFNITFPLDIFFFFFYNPFEGILVQKSGCLGLKDVLLKFIYFQALSLKSLFNLILEAS